MKATIRSERYFICPNNCSQKFVIEQELKKSETSNPSQFKVGPWYCDRCHAGWNVEFIAGKVNITPSESKIYLQYSLLQLSDQKSIYFVVKDIRSDKEITEELLNFKRFHYEENTAMTNILSSTEEIYHVTVDEENEKVISENPTIFRFVTCKNSMKEIIQELENETN